MSRLSELRHFDKKAGTMKSFNAGTKCTLKKPNFCPDNGETLKYYSRKIEADIREFSLE